MNCEFLSTLEEPKEQFSLWNTFLCCCSWYLVRKSWLRANHFSVRFSRLVGMSYYIICIAVGEYGNTKSRIFCFIISIIIICEQDILPFKDGHFFRWYKSFVSPFFWYRIACLLGARLSLNERPSSTHELWLWNWTYSLSHFASTLQGRRALSVLEDFFL